MKMFDCNGFFSRAVELEELYTKIQIITGFSAEQLLELFRAGYTIEPPNYDLSLRTVSNLLENQQKDQLTEEQLKKMVGHPIWLKTPKRKEWVLLWGYHEPEVCGRSFVFTRRTAEKVQLPFSELGITWWPYRHSPEGEPDGY